MGGNPLPLKPNESGCHHCPYTKGLGPLLPNQGLIRDLPQLPRPPAHKTNYFDKKKPSIANSTLPPISSNDPRPLLQGLPPSPTCLHAPPPPCQLPGPTRFRSNPDHHAHADNGLVLNCIRIFTDYFAFIQISTQIRGAPILNGIPAADWRTNHLHSNRCILAIVRLGHRWPLSFIPIRDSVKSTKISNQNGFGWFR